MRELLFFECRFNKVGPRGGRKTLALFSLDLIKVFDKVPRGILFIYKFGVRGKLFRFVRDMYTDNIAKVLINNRYSREFKIKPGVLQGSILGPVFLSFFIPDLLESLDASCLGAKIGDMIISALDYADDIILISDPPEKEQRLIIIGETWSKINYMPFNISKGDAMALDRLPTGLINLKL